MDLRIDSSMYIQIIHTTLPLLLHIFLLLFDWMETHNLLGLEKTLEGEYPLNFCSEDVFQLSKP